MGAQAETVLLAELLLLFGQAAHEHRALPQVPFLDSGLRAGSQLEFLHPGHPTSKLMASEQASEWLCDQAMYGLD